MAWRAARDLYARDIGAALDSTGTPVPGTVEETPRADT